MATPRFWVIALIPWGNFAVIGLFVDGENRLTSLWFDALLWVGGRRGVPLSVWPEISPNQRLIKALAALEK